MKLTINLLIRKALLLAIAISSVNTAMAEPVIADMSTVTSGTPFADTTDNEGIILDYTGGYTGGGIKSFTSTTGIYIKDALAGGASGNGALYMIGDLHDYTDLEDLDGYVAPTDADSGDIQYRMQSGGDLSHADIYYGDHSEFSGRFLMATASTGQVKDFFFGNATDASSNMTNIAGIGAIEFGLRAGVAGASNTSGTDLANNSVGNISFFYSGTASITNSHINANNITLNGAASGSITSDNFKTSQNAAGSNGATYTITSELNINELILNDGSDVILQDKATSISTMSISAVRFAHANSTLTIGTGAATIGTLHMTAAGSSLSVTAAGSSIADINFVHAGNAVSIAAGGALTLTGTQTLLGAGQIDVAGTLNLDATVQFDISGVDNSLWQVSGNTYTLQLIDIIEGGTLNGFTGLNQNDNLIFAGSSIYDITFDEFGAISYTRNAKDLQWGGGSASWNTTDAEWLEGSTESAFTQGDNVTFGASSDMENVITIVGAISAEAITVDSDQNYTFGGDGSLADPASLVKSGTGTLTISTENTFSGGTTLNEGTLRINSSEALGTGELTINGGTLGFFGSETVTLDSSKINLTSGALNINLETNAAITGSASLGTHTLNVTGTGTLEYTDWASMSSVNVDAGATVNFSSASSSSNNEKAIMGDGQIIIGFSALWGSRLKLDSANLFTGDLKLDSVAQTYFNITGGDDSARMGLTMVAGADLVLFASSHSTLYLNELSGEGLFRYDWGTNSTMKRSIDLEMSANNTFDGTFSHDADRMGSFTVSSVEEEVFNFTMNKNGYTDGTSAHLNIENAKVIFFNSADWRGAINLQQSSSELHYSGNDYTRSASMGAITGLGTLHIDANVTLQGANTYSGGTVIHSDSLTVEHVDAIGSGSVRMLGGSLDLNGLAIDNAVRIDAAGASISGFSGYTGALTVAANLTVTDRLAAGSISVETGASLTLNGEWDYSSLISNEGSLTFGSDLIIDLTDISFITTDNMNYTLTLFEGAGSSELTAWLGAGGEVDLSKLTGEAEGYTYSYSNGVLSYSTGEIYIPDGNDQTINGSSTPNITLGGDTAEAILGNGFGQAADSTITGSGTVIVADGATVTLGEANDYSGGTELRAGAIVNVGTEGALGTGSILSQGNSQIVIEAGASMDNNVEFEGAGQVSAGVLTASASEAGASIMAADGSDLRIQHDASGAGSIMNAVLTDMAVTLAMDGEGSISNTTLINTDITLGLGATLTMTNSVQGIGSTISNADAKLILQNHKIQVSSAMGGGLTINDATQSIVTQEGGTHDMNVYSLTSIDVADATLGGTLTLDVVLVSEYGEFEALAKGGEFIAFELVGIGEDDFTGSYLNVEINIYDGSLDTLAHTYTPFGYSSSEGGNLVFYIPEPSTATLSLLALTGLLARRRRKTEN